MILVLVDHDRGVLDPLSLRALTAARKLSSDVQAVVMGRQGANLATEIGEYGANTLFVATNEVFADYTPMASGKALLELVTKINP